MKQILVPRKTGDERKRNHKFSTQKKIKKYIKGGSEGGLNLRNSPIDKLPDNLEVGGNLDLRNTPLSKKYTERQIRKLIAQKGGYVMYRLLS